MLEVGFYDGISSITCDKDEFFAILKDYDATITEFAFSTIDTDTFESKTNWRQNECQEESLRYVITLDSSSGVKVKFKHEDDEMIVRLSLSTSK